MDEDQGMDCQLDEDDDEWSRPIIQDQQIHRDVSGKEASKRNQRLHDDGRQATKSPKSSKSTSSVQVGFNTHLEHPRTIVHIDIDCFYAQVEMINNPALRNLPLGVQQKYLVVTCNYPARARGVTKCMGITEARKKCPELVLVSGEDLTSYRVMSYRISEFLAKYTPHVERLGFDENFLDVTEMVEQRIQGKTARPEVVGHIYTGDVSSSSSDSASPTSTSDSVTPTSKPCPSSSSDSVTPTSKPCPSSSSDHVTPTSKPCPSSSSDSVTPTSKPCPSSSSDSVTPTSKPCPSSSSDSVTPTSKPCPCGCHHRLAVGWQIAADIRSALEIELGITCCAGVAHNKLMAKLAGSQHKPSQQTTVHPHTALRLLTSLDSVHRIPGVGWATSKRLKTMGVVSVTDLQNFSLPALEDEFGVAVANNIQQLAFGVDDSPVVAYSKPQMLSIEDSFRCCDSAEDACKRIRELIEDLLPRAKEDGRTPHTFRLTVRKLNKEAPHEYHRQRESRQCVLPSSVATKITSGDLGAACQRLVSMAMTLFGKMVNTSRPFHLTLINVAFTNLKDTAGTDIASFFSPNSSSVWQKVSSTFTQNSTDDGLDAESELDMDVSSRDIDFNVDDVSVSQLDTDAVSHSRAVNSKSKLLFADTKPRYGSPLCCTITSVETSAVKTASISSNESGKMTLASGSKTTANAVISKQAGNSSSKSPFTPNLHSASHSASKRKRPNSLADYFTKTQKADDTNVMDVGRPRQTQQRADAVKIKDAVDAEHGHVILPPNVDPQVFAQLPVDIQKEILQSAKQNLHTSNVQGGMKLQTYADEVSTHSSSSKHEKQKLHTGVQGGMKVQTCVDEVGAHSSTSEHYEKQKLHAGTCQGVNSSSTAECHTSDHLDRAQTSKQLCSVKKVGVTSPLLLDAVKAEPCKTPARKIKSYNDSDRVVSCLSQQTNSNAETEPEISEPSTSMDERETNAETPNSATADSSNACPLTVHLQTPQGIDAEVFSALPPDIQREIAAEMATKKSSVSKERQTNSLTASSSKSPKKVNSVLNYFRKK